MKNKNEYNASNMTITKCVTKNIDKNHSTPNLYQLIHRSLSHLTHLLFRLLESKGILVEWFGRQPAKLVSSALASSNLAGVVAERSACSPIGLEFEPCWKRFEGPRGQTDKTWDYESRDYRLESCRDWYERWWSAFCAFFCKWEHLNGV